VWNGSRHFLFLAHAETDSGEVVFLRGNKNYWCRDQYLATNSNGMMKKER
jgi:hypothetical protein